MMKLSVLNQQKQAVSQKMIQASEILQMTSVQLETYLYEKSMENPVLELLEKPAEEFEQRGLEKYQWISEHDEQNRYLYQRIEQPDMELQERNGKEDLETLKEYLWSQLIMENYSAKQEQILDYILESLDSKGYFQESIDTVALRLQVSSKEVEELLEVVQQMEPYGVGARNLEECLCLQLKAQGRLSEALNVFIKKHLKKMAKNQLPAIAKEMQVSLEKVKEYCQIVRELEPKPGARFSDVRQLSYIIPDVVIVKFRDHFSLMLNESLYPDISVNPEYVRMCNRQEDDEVKKYLTEKIHQVEWLKQCVAQRNKTLFSVAQVILLRQEAFFRRGKEYLRPLRMGEAAEVLGIHESTISRAVKQKYVQCTWGIFPMSYFFAKAAVERTDENGHTAVQTTASDVKRQMLELIQNENHKKPYSDYVLARMLEERGFSISRRTITKYREELGIPSMSGRKEY